MAESQTIENKRLKILTQQGYFKLYKNHVDDLKEVYDELFLTYYSHCNEIEAELALEDCESPDIRGAIERMGELVRSTQKQCSLTEQMLNLLQESYLETEKYGACNFLFKIFYLLPHLLHMLVREFKANSIIKELERS